MGVPLTNQGLYGHFSICDKDIIEQLNANFQLLDNIVQLGVDDIVASLPLSPSEGDRYILSTDKTLNTWDGTQWITYPAIKGYISYVADEVALYIFDGSDWIKFDGTGIPLNEIAFGTGAGITSDEDLIYFSNLNEVGISVKDMDSATAKTMVIQGANDPNSDYTGGEVIVRAGQGNSKGSVWIEGRNITLASDTTISANGSRVSNVQNPTGKQDAATKKYVDDGLALINNFIRPGLSAYKNTSQSIATGTETTIIGWVETSDPLNNFNPTTGVFTVSVAGWYNISAVLSLEPGQTWAIGNIFDVIIITSAGTSRVTKIITQANMNWISKSLSMNVYLTVGNTIYIQVSQNSAGSRNLGLGSTGVPEQRNRISIGYLGK